MAGWASTLVLVNAGLTAVVLPVEPARAGYYDVYACSSAVAGGANNAFVSQADAGMASYSECPAGQGITVRNAWDGGRTPWLQGAYATFDSPPGTLIDSIEYEAGYQRHDCKYSVAVVASDGDFGGRIVWGLPANSDCTALETPGSTNFFSVVWRYPVNASRVRIETRCGGSSCSRDGVSAMRIRNVRVRVADNTPPTLTGGRGELWTSNGWLSGTRDIGFDASDGAGIRNLSISVDGKEIGQRTPECDFTQRAPCPSSSLERAPNTAGWGGDGPHTIELHAIDAAGNPSSVARTVLVDNTPPGPPEGLSVAGGDGWRSLNDFDVSWKLPDRRSGSPVAAAEYELCTGTPERCTRGSRSGRDITSLTDLKVPGAGEYRLRVFLRDGAGNSDRQFAAPAAVLRLDNESPRLTFAPMSAEDPTRVVVDTTDAGSGVVGGQIDMRRRGATTWASLPTSVEGTRLVAHFDDERLGDGVFELRARAVDAAGNERTTGTKADGNPAEITLPLRLKTTLRAGVVVRTGGRRARLARTARIPYGRTVRVRGRLTSPLGNPLQGVEVQVYSQVEDGVTAPVPLVRATTSRSGRFSFLVRRGPNRKILIRYVGTSQIRSATRVVRLNVRARTTLRSGRRSFVNGETMTLRGRVRTGRIPETGKLVELQVWQRQRWHTFATARTGRRGTWRRAYRFDGTHGRQVFRLRARLPREAGYPFVTGDSRVVRVAVRGL